jgi:hypothetical protein
VCYITGFVVIYIRLTGITIIAAFHTWHVKFRDCAVQFSISEKMFAAGRKMALARMTCERLELNVEVRFHTD